MNCINFLRMSVIYKSIDLDNSDNLRRRSVSTARNKNNLLFVKLILVIINRVYVLI